MSPVQVVGRVRHPTKFLLRERINFRNVARRCILACDAQRLRTPKIASASSPIILMMAPAPFTL
jgi:hypothetical protein